MIVHVDFVYGQLCLLIWCCRHQHKNFSVSLEENWHQLARILHQCFTVEVDLWKWVRKRFSGGRWQTNAIDLKSVNLSLNWIPNMFWNIICYYIFLFIDKNSPLYVCMFFRKGFSNFSPQCVYVELWTPLGARSSIHKCHGWTVYSLQVFPKLFSFLILVLVQLCRGRPCFLWPCGFQSQPLWWYCSVVFFIMSGQSIVTLFLICRVAFYKVRSNKNSFIIFTSQHT